MTDRQLMISLDKIDRSNTTSPRYHATDDNDDTEYDNNNTHLTPAITVTQVDREVEKLENQTKQLENYYNINSADTNKAGNTDNHLLSSKNSKLTDFDSHTEYLLYMVVIEFFFMFVTYAHYPHLDKWNKFLTPIVIGGETSLLGQTLSQLFSWINKDKRTNNKKDDEEFKFGTTRNINNGHKRTPSSYEISFSASAKLDNVALSLDLSELKANSIKNHLKFLSWGSLNGLLSSYWIEFLLQLFPNDKKLCVILDQSAGTLIFQVLYTLFIIIWDGEVEIRLPENGDLESINLELTWDNFYNHYASMLWKHMKLSYLVWPAISFLSFTVMPEQWIFPLNCIATTVFSVCLGI